jgi:bifunctional DNA-binding transcriptional regulator/antitoxin component of YhaV-PrlF toxin-antitoxin module
MNVKTAKATSKGQITLPNQWRKQFKTNDFLLVMEKKQLVVKPLYLDKLSDDEVLFDAERDNEGKGIAVEDMIQMIESIQSE